MPQTIREQKAKARATLELLRKLDVNAVVAGGAPRNWVENKVARDLDFFIHLPQRMDAKYMLELVLGVTVIPKVGDTSYEGEYINGVWEYESDTELPQQIIILRKPAACQEVLRHFTCNASQIAHNGFTYHHTEEFMRCHREKVLTFDFRMHGYKLDYLNKMLDYYPDYTVDMESIKFPDNMRPEHDNTRPVRPDDTINFDVPFRRSPAVPIPWVIE